MPWYYVYSPLTGYCTSNISAQEYCVGGSHPIVRAGFSAPMDIGFSTPCPQTLDFICTYTVRSVKITQHNGIVCAGSVPGGIDDAVEVEMYQGYNGTGTKIGNVLFGHMASRHAGGIFNTIPRGDGITATLADHLGVSPGECNNDWGYSCYQGLHVHIEAKSYQSYNTALQNCSSYPFAFYGTTWVYEYFVP